MVRCAFWVTGFGPFAGVEDNPTQQLIRLLREHIAAGGDSDGHGTSPAGYRILGTDVLEVAGEPCRRWVEYLFRSCLAAAPEAAPAQQAAAAAAAAQAPAGRRARQPPAPAGGTASAGGGGHAAAPAPAAAAAGGCPVVVLHLGVDVKADHFKLEQQAVNEATFRVPDQWGWQPQGQLIDDHPGLELGTRLHTDLDAAALAGRLRAQGFDAQPSTDAGRFLCNYTLYLSLCESQKARARRGRPLHALFLHVPPLAVAPLGRQFELLLALLAAIADQLAPAAAAPKAAVAAAAAAAEGEEEVEDASESAAAVQPSLAASGQGGTGGGGVALQEVEAMAAAVAL